MEFTKNHESFYCLSEKQNNTIYLYLINFENFDILESMNVFDNDLYIERPYSDNRFFVSNLLMSPDEKTCIFLNRNHYILYSLTERKIINTLSFEGSWHENKTMKLFFTENDDLLFSINNRSIGVSGTAYGDTKHLIDLQSVYQNGQDIEISKDGRYIVYTPKFNMNYSSVLRSYDFKNKKCISINKNYDIIDIFLSNDNKSLAIQDKDGYIELDHINDLGEFDPVNFDRYKCDTKTFVDFHSMNNKILLSDMNDIEIYNYAENKLIKELNLGSDMSYFLPNSENIVSITKYRNNVSIINPLLSQNNNEYEIISSFTHNGFKITDFCIDKSGKYLVTCSMDTTTKIWDINTGEMLKEYKFSKFVPIRVAISNNNKYIATMDEYSNLIVWNTLDIPNISSKTEDDNKQQNRTFNLYPNPADNSLNISYEKEVLDVEAIIINSLGLPQRTKIEYNDRVITINTSSLSPGVYFLRIRSGGQVETKKFVVVR